MTERDEKELIHSNEESVQEMRSKIAELDGKIARITDLFVEQDIDREEYLKRKYVLLSEKRSLQDKILHLERNQTIWLEPMREWINEASMLEETAKSKDYPSKKSPKKNLRLEPAFRRARGARHPEIPVGFFVGGQRNPRGFRHKF